MHKKTTAPHVGSWMVFFLTKCLKNAFHAEILIAILNYPGTRDPGPAFSTYPGKGSAREKRTKVQKADNWRQDSSELESIFLRQYQP